MGNFYQGLSADSNEFAEIETTEASLQAASDPTTEQETAREGEKGL